MKRLCLLMTVCAALEAASLTGTWVMSVDLESGDHGDPVFELKDTNGRLFGKYSGPFGEQAVFGSVEGNVVQLRVAASGTVGTIALDYKGKLDGDDKMSGTMTRKVSGKVTEGKWTAVRKK